MATKIAINGFGRIGRQAFRRIVEKHPDLDVIAINDLTDTKTIAHLLKYDSNYGKFGKDVESGEGFISVDGKKINVFAEKEPKLLPWKKLGVSLVLECTGIFIDQKGAGQHLEAGAKMVIISAPAKDPSIPSYVLGVNEDKFDIAKDKIVDMGSCTTNCLAPIAKVLNDNFIIKKGFMTTTHSYTNDQRILDLPHKDLRRARAAGVNIIPTSTGAAKAIGKVIPELLGKLDGISLRVPTPTVSFLDLIFETEKPITVQTINEALEKAAGQKGFKGILKVEKEPLVSSDFIGDSYSSIVDLALTMAKESLGKVGGWYDNEWGYACRLAQFAEFVGERI